MMIPQKKLRTTVLEPLTEIFVVKVEKRDVMIYFALVNKLRADQILGSGKNDNNRNFNEQQVARIVEDMEGGHWRTTHQGLAFDFNRNLIDGQHRLRGVSETNTEWIFLVSEGWDPINRVNVDLVWTRQLRDALKMMGTTDRADVVANSLHSLRRYLDSNCVKLGFDEAKEMIETYSGGVKWIAQADIPRRRGPLSSGAIMAAFVYAYPKISEIIDKAWTDLQVGEELRSDDPIFQLRERVVRGKLTRSDEGRRRCFDLTLAALYRRTQRATRAALRESEEARKFFDGAY